MEFTQGHVYACIGLAAAFILASIGSSMAVGRGGKMASALLTKDPSKFISFLILQLLPATQSIYSFIVSFIALNKMGIVSGSIVAMSTAQGWAVLLIALPTGIIGLLSAIFQGAVGMAGMELCMKQEKQMVKAMIMAALVEIFAILAFVLSFIGINGVIA